MKKLFSLLLVSMLSLSIFSTLPIASAAGALYEENFDKVTGSSVPASLKPAASQTVEVTKDPSGRAGNALHFKKALTAENASAEASIAILSQKAKFTFEFDYYVTEGSAWCVMTEGATFPYGPGIALSPVITPFDGVAQKTTGVKSELNKWLKMAVVTDPTAGTYQIYQNAKLITEVPVKFRNAAVASIDTFIFRTSVGTMSAEFYVDNLKAYVGDVDKASLVPSAPEPPCETPKPATQNANYTSDMAKATIINQRLANAVVLMIDNPTAYVNNKEMQIDENKEVVPIIENEKTLVPVRFISGNFKADVNFEDATSTINVTLGTQKVKMVLGDTKIDVNGKVSQMVVPAQEKNGRTLIPLRDMVEALGKKVFWDDRGLIILSDTENIFDAVKDKDLISAIIDRAKGVEGSLLKRPFTIAFIGGSITQGGGASSATNNYVTLVSKGIADLLPNQKITTVNAGIGGTSSGLGVFRVQRDVISKNPDMVFIEYAVNDTGLPMKYCQAAIEGIIAQLQAMPKPPMVYFIYTTNQTKIGIGMDVHQPVANYYGLPSADLQSYVWSQVDKGTFKILDIMPDGIHPNDRGHKLYADFIVESIKNDPKATLVAPVKRDALMTGYAFKNPRLAPFGEAKATGSWKEEVVGNANSIEKAIVSSTPGDTLEFKFSGKCIGLYHIASQDAGIMEISIDGVLAATVDTYKNMKVPYSQFQRFDLEDKAHTLTIKVSEKKNAATTGQNIRIGYFLTES